jgi:hypothetical protein
MVDRRQHCSCDEGGRRKEDERMHRGCLHCDCVVFKVGDVRGERRVVFGDR